jgi:hypothetical protein
MFSKRKAARGIPPIQQQLAQQQISTLKYSQMKKNKRGGGLIRKRKRQRQ